MSITEISTAKKPSVETSSVETRSVEKPPVEKPSVARFVVLVSQYKNKSSYKFQHKRINVAVIETNGQDMPKQINARHKAVVRMVSCEKGLFQGVTDKCQAAQGMKRAETLCRNLNEIYRHKENQQWA